MKRLCDAEMATRFPDARQRTEALIVTCVARELAEVVRMPVVASFGPEISTRVSAPELVGPIYFFPLTVEERNELLIMSTGDIRGWLADQVLIETLR